MEIGYVSQSRMSLNDDNTVHEEISSGVHEIDMGGGKMLDARKYTACFRFRGSDQSKLIKQLSGGERNRVHLAKMLNRGTLFSHVQRISLFHLASSRISFFSCYKLGILNSFFSK